MRRIACRQRRGDVARRDGERDPTRQKRVELRGERIRVGPPDGDQLVTKVALDLGQVLAHHRPGRLGQVRHPDRRVEIGTPSRPIAFEPVRDRAEEGGDDLGRWRGGLLHLRPDPLDPARPGIAQPGHDQVVLRREMAVERGLRHARRLDQGVHAGRTDTLSRESVRRGGEDALAGRRRVPGPGAEHATDQRARVGEDRLEDDGLRMPGDVVGTDHEVGQAAQGDLQARFEVDDPTDAGHVLERPLHVADQSRPGEPEGSALGHRGADQVDHRGGVEATAAEIGIGPRVDAQGAAVERGFGVQARPFEALEVGLTAPTVDEMDGPLVLRDALHDERQEQRLPVGRPVEKRADMTLGS